MLFGLSWITWLQSTPCELYSCNLYLERGSIHAFYDVLITLLLISLGGVHVFILATAGVDKKVKLWTAPDVGST
jgi:hypothetical protein